MDHPRSWWNCGEIRNGIGALDDKCAAACHTPLRLTRQIVSGQGLPIPAAKRRLFGVVVLGDRVVQPLQRRAVTGEIALLLRVLGRADRRLDLLQHSRFGR